MFVVATGRRAEPLEAVATEIRGLGGTAAAYQLDVRDSQAVLRVVREVTKASGPIDVLVSCAGVLHRDFVEDVCLVGERRPAELEYEHFAHVVYSAFSMT